MMMMWHVGEWLYGLRESEEGDGFVHYGLLVIGVVMESR